MVLFIIFALTTSSSFIFSANCINSSDSLFCSIKASVANLDEVPTTGPTAVPPIVPMAASLIARLATSFGSVSLPAILSEAISVLAATKPSVTAPVVASLAVSLAIEPAKLFLVSSATFVEVFTGHIIYLVFYLQKLYQLNH